MVFFLKALWGQATPYFLMDQESLLFESSRVIKQDLGSTPYVRHYMQEQSFTCNENDSLKAELPFNHVINQIVSELSIMNKQIASNSKLTTSLLENGRDIYSKKRQFFEEFKKQYPIIRDSLNNMTPHYRFVFQYSVMALSNLILKLSINMAKISIIVVTKILTPSYLNLFTVAILFEKYLESQLVIKKNFNSPEQHRHFLKQFPKITVLKISKKHNPYDVEFIQRSQTTFNRNYSNEQNFKQGQVYNIQFIEFFEEESENVNKTNKCAQQYSRHDVFNLSKFGLKAPLGFELYLLISEIVIGKMNDFKPDIIIYIQEFDNDIVSIDPKIRGLIINQLSEKVQHKIYVFKQFGITQQMKTSWLEETIEQQQPQFNYQFTKKISQISKNTGSTSKSFIDQCEMHEERKTSIKTCMEQNMKITHDIFKKLQNHLKVEYRKNTIYAVNNPTQSNIVFTEQLKKMHKNMLEDLAYISLALIQKSNFQQTINAYRNYIFRPQFLQRVMQWIYNQLHLIQNEKVFSQVGEMYKIKIKKIKGMQALSMVSPQLLKKQFTFYNFLHQKQEKLQYIQGNRHIPIPIGKQDSFYVAYVENFIIVILFGQAFYSIYRKNKKDQFFKNIKMGYLTNENPSLFKKHSTFVANNKYFYKAFGESHIAQLNNESEIFRICIQKPMELQWSKWQKIGSQCIPYSSNEKLTKKPSSTIPIQFKRHGFGYSYDTLQKQKEVNITLFGGGFNFKIQNEEKVNRYFYIIRDNSKDIYKIGKTNGQLVDQTTNMRNKTIIYPFVYGIPIMQNQGELNLINTNGYLENVNHHKKLFLTKLKIGPINTLSSIGIIGQNKLDYNKESSQIAVANKNTILSYLMYSYNKINRYKNQVALYNADNQILILQNLKQTLIQHFDVVRVTSICEQQISENFQTLSVRFAAKKMILKQQ